MYMYIVYMYMLYACIYMYTCTCTLYVLEVVYGLCLSKSSTPRDGCDHAVVVHLLSSCSQLHNIGEMDYTSSRVDGANTTTQAVRGTTTITTTTSGS